MNTKDQHQSPLWHSERRLRITSSHFGDIKRRLASTPPDSLVLRILGVKRFSTAATQWGKDHEEVALDAYVTHQNDCGHSGLYACKSGFVVLRQIHFLEHLQMAVCMTRLVAILLVWLKSSVLTAIDTPHLK